MQHQFQNIPNSNNWKKIQAIHKGWSGEEKYFIETQSGDHYLLRIGEQSKLVEEKELYQIYDQLKKEKQAIPEVIESGYCNNGQNTYRLLTWLEGEDALAILPKLPGRQQYELGLQAGKIQKQFHQLPASQNNRSWAEYYNWKIDRNLKNYHACGLRFPEDDCFIDYVENHRFLLNERPQCFHHGDFHIGNMLIQRDGKLAVIDINRLDYGDPYEEFNRIIWNASASEAFANGIINGYFQEIIPDEFFPLMALYVSSNLLGGLSWAMQFGENETKIIMKQSNQVRNWYQNFETYIPNWFSKQKND